MNRLGLFAKYWQPGRVKTRLAASIGAHAAAKLHQAFVACLAERLKNVADERVIVFTPEENRAEFIETAGRSWMVQPQSAGDLGQRMRSFFSSALANGADRVVVIGSDSPTLPIEFIEQAFESLRRNPVVLGPSRDGGYYLVGLAAPMPDMFLNVEWGTPRVWQQTIACLEREKTPFTELRPWYDIDEIDDLRQLETELREQRSSHSAFGDLANVVERECGSSDG